ncbi:hypothetical protein [Streptacidiphilus monticola]|uniref:Uncharacterized protein n=1 Tax=Streptacidiphilus monticola TaxID=2161674 RepID=A0ABW1G078_9ACTN
MASTRTRPVLAAATAALAGVADAVGLWWKPWQSADLPGSACWGLLTAADLKPLAGADGKASTSTLHTATSGLERGGTAGQCLVWWNRDRTLLNVSTRAVPKSSVGGASPVAPVTLGPGIVLYPERDAVEVYFRCDGTTVPGASYAEVGVDHGPYPLIGNGDAPEKVRQAYAAVALKVSRAVARQLPCGNPLAFPDAAPALPPLTGGE